MHVNIVNIYIMCFVSFSLFTLCYSFINIYDALFHKNMSYQQSVCFLVHIVLLKWIIAVII